MAERRRQEKARREALCDNGIDVSHQKELMDNFEADF